MRSSSNASKVISFSCALRYLIADPIELQSALNALAALLGAPFEPPKPLQPIAGPSNPILQQHQQRTSIGRKASNGSFKPDTTGAARKRSFLGATENDERKEVWLDIGGQILEELQADLNKAVEERVSTSIHKKQEARDDCIL